MTFKNIVKEMGKAKTVYEFNQVYAEIKASFEFEESITFEEYELLYNIAERLSWAVE